MTAQETIDRVDLLAPNAYGGEQKLRWLSELDGRVFRELFCAHEPPCPPPWPPEGYDDGERELLLEGPYAAQIYENYLLSRIAERNAEIDKYNLYATLFNDAYRSFAALYTRTHRPRQRGTWRL